MPPKLLISDRRGRVVEHPHLLATVRSGEELLAPTELPIPLPRRAQLAHLPGRVPVGLNPDTDELELVPGAEAVGVLLPPGYTRTYLPGEVKGEGGPMLPQWAYTAAGWAGEAVTWAVRTDRRQHWNPDRFSTGDLPKRIDAHRARLPGNRVLTQLTTCASNYRCFTAQNVFYERDEGAIPVSVMCNARCVGCISDQPKGGPPASHQRIEQGPTADEMAEVALHHLRHATGRKMVSFGQGCEGEPLTRHKEIEKAIRIIRRKLPKGGSIQLNTNGSLPHGLAALFEAGLDAVRISLNSASGALYEAYYQPIGYGFSDVEASMAVTRKAKGYLALNLLLFPGITDREGEVAALSGLIRRHRVDHLQTRSLCIDPLQYLEVAGKAALGGPSIGVRAMLGRLKREAPWLKIGNFARGAQERAI